MAASRNGTTETTGRSSTERGCRTRSRKRRNPTVPLSQHAGGQWRRRRQRRRRRWLLVGAVQLRYPRDLIVRLVDLETKRSTRSSPPPSHRGTTVRTSRWWRSLFAKFTSNSAAAMKAQCVPYRRSKYPQWMETAADCLSNRAPDGMSSLPCNNRLLPHHHQCR